jgi:hypothetical protein
MMASSGIWIAPLIERLLSRYLDGPKSETHLEDDGSNLRFADNSPHSALIMEVSKPKWIPIGRDLLKSSSLLLVAGRRKIAGD